MKEQAQERDGTTEGQQNIVQELALGATIWDGESRRLRRQDKKGLSPEGIEVQRADGQLVLSCM